MLKVGVSKIQMGKKTAFGGTYDLRSDNMAIPGLYTKGLKTIRRGLGITSAGWARAEAFTEKAQTDLGTN